MNLYIETENGQPINHPAFEDNLMQAFGEIPANWETFTRVEKPAPTLYQILDNQEPVYIKVAGVWTDVWSLREMTVTERAARQQTAKDAWATRDQASNFTAWVLDVATCTFVPPIQRPVVADKIFRWFGADNNFKEAPLYPETGGPYKFNFTTWIWVAV